MTTLNEPISRLFIAHKVDASIDQDWVLINGGEIRVNGRLVRDGQESSMYQVQLDVRFLVPPGYQIVESFAGMGPDRDAAIANSLQNFASSSFHVLLDAFLRPNDQQVTREEIDFGGRKRLVTLGNTLARGHYPCPPERMTEWFRYFEEKLKSQALGPGLHWIRCYCAQLKGKLLASEVLLNNFAWEEMEKEMAAFDWPKGEQFYGLRTFLVVHPEAKPNFGAESAVAALTDLIAMRESFTEDDAYKAMASVGIPPLLADRAFKYTQVAWGRALLSGLGIKFSPDFIWMNGAGEISEKVVLDEDPIFREASRLATIYKAAPGFRHMAMMSALFNALNKALKAGSKPEGLQMSPSVAFSENPTPMGLQKANESLRQLLDRNAKRPAPPATIPPVPAPKSRWKFWK